MVRMEQTYHLVRTDPSRFLTAHRQAAIELPRDHGKTVQVCGRIARWRDGVGRRGMTKSRSVPTDRSERVGRYTVLMPPSGLCAASTVWLANLRLKSAATRTYSTAWCW
jgi:hypothetical protein